MKIFVSTRPLKKFLWPLAFFLVAVLFVTVGTTIYRNLDAPESEVSESIIPGGSTVAILGALDRFGADTAETAVEIWADGVLERNGAAQYSVMSTDLKDAYILTLGDGNWLFDVTKPAYVNYAVSGITENEDGSVLFTLSFLQNDSREDTSAGASLELREEDGRMVISSLEIDSALSAYTGIQ